MYSDCYNTDTWTNRAGESIPELTVTAYNINVWH